MRYKSGDILFYVNPFVFTIEVVKIEFALEEEGGLFYIDSVGAYLAEHDLWKTLINARADAITKLDKFYQQKKHEICSQNPKLAGDDEDGNSTY